MTTNSQLIVPEVSGVIINAGEIAATNITSSPELAIYTTDNGQRFYVRAPMGYRTITSTSSNTPATNIILPSAFTGTPTSGVNQITTTDTWVTTSNAVTSYQVITGTTATGYITYSNGGIIIHNGTQWEPPTDWVERQARQARRYERDRRLSIHKAKSSIKKALKLIDNMGFGDEIRVFIGGDEIVVDNPQSIFKFVLKRGASLIERTISPGYSTPYSLELLTKDDIHVANLCVYLKDTPVLDQVLAIALYIKTGNEEDVLEKANWFNRTNDNGVRRLVHEYNPKFGRKLGFNLPYEEPQGRFNIDIRGDLIVG
jgi:hypothetical protein